jgi:hypothetical protein
MASLFGYCIHTFRHSDDLQKQQKDGGSHTLTEGKAWRTGRQLWIDAERAAERMPILFSGADVHTGLIYWAAIDDIRIDDETRQTTCSYSALRSIAPPKLLSTLRLRSGDRPVSDDLIRPYAICHTPDFLA